MKASRCAMVLAVLALGPGGCQEDVEDPELARRVIGPRGGTITSTDSVLTLAIPPGALDQEIELFIERTNEPPAAFGQAYLVRPNPALHYDLGVSYRQELPDDVSGLAVGAIDAIAYEDGRGQWEPLTLLRVDRQAKLVSGLDDSVSIFYALLDDSAGEPSATDDGASGSSTTGVDATSDSGSSGETTGPSATTGPGESSESSEGGSTGEPGPSFASVVQPILTASCNCHLEAAPAGLSFTDAYANLVSVASTEAAGLDRVAPGSPDDSYLWHKVNGTHASVGGSGDPMPAPGGGLDAGSLATIEAWISGGAEP